LVTCFGNRLPLCGIEVSLGLSEAALSSLRSSSLGLAARHLARASKLLD
jgi:hypothetical protein